MTKPRVKVVILCTAHTALDIRVFHKEAKSLAQNGYEVVVIAQHDKEEIIEGVRIVPLPAPKSRIDRLTKTMWKLIVLAVREKAVVYHFHDPELMLFCLFLKLCGKKVIYDVHEDYSLSIRSKDYLPVLIRYPLSFLLGFAERIASSCFDLVILAIDRMRNKFSSHNLVVIHNYPFIYKNIDADVRQNTVFTITYAGPLAQIRGIAQVIKAIELLNNNGVKLVLMGEFVTPEYERHLRTMKGWQQVEYLGVKPHHDVLRVFAMADLGIECSLPIPNYLYAESNKIFEYMSVGLPVLCSNLPRIREIVEGNNCGKCIDPSKPEDIANGISYFMNNREIRKKMGESGKMAIQSRYNWSVEEKILINEYNKISS